MEGFVPTEDVLLTRIAQKASASTEQVRRVLDSHRIVLRPPVPADRRVLLRRLVVAGEKSGVRNGTNGPFLRDIALGPGAWAIASRINSAGKSSLMWALAFALRGESDEVLQRPESFKWFKFIRLDAEISGVAVSVRLHIESESSYRAVMLSANSVDDLVRLDYYDEEAPGVGVVDRAAGKAAVADLVSRFMMERLGLRPLELFAADRHAPVEDGGRDGAVQTHQWPSYFPMISIMSASDAVLFGKNATGNIATRLMQAFLDVPFVADLMAAAATAKVVRQDVRHAERRAREDAEARQRHRSGTEDELAAAQAHLAALRTSTPDVLALRNTLREASYALARVDQRLAAANRLFGEARRLRLDDERELRAATESAASRALFAALNPHMCPRCEHPIDGARRRREQTDHLCAVCTTPLGVAETSPEDREQALKSIRDRLKATRAAEAQARQAVEAAHTQHADAVSAEEHAKSALDSAYGLGNVDAQLRDAELDVARLVGAVGAMTRIGPEDAATREDDFEATVLLAANDVLKATANQVTQNLFDKLNEEIVTLARELGVANLDSVTLSPSGQFKATKSKDAKATFKGFSPGERLRLRVAIIITMIRVGRLRGIRSHPGLLLVDSPADVEVVSGDVKLMLDKLVALGDDIDGLQLVVATGHDAVWDAFPEDRLITGPDRDHMF